MPRWSRWFWMALLPLIAVCLLGLGQGCKPDSTPAAAAGNNSDYLFCFWNVENFFDDRVDNRTGPGDKEYDGWVARNPGILKLKLDKLTEALLKLNDGKGP